MTTQETSNNTAKDNSRCKDRALIFKALAHSTRIQIVQALEQREHCVHELVELVGDDPSTISKHLTILKTARVVTCDRRGTLVFYRLKMKCVTGFIACIDKAIVSSAQEQIGRVE